MNNLPMDTASRMERAKQLGFTVLAYHGSGQKFDQFDLAKGKPSILSGYGPHFADQKAEAKGYADDRKAEGKKSHVFECLLRIHHPFIASYTIKLSEKEFKRLTGRSPRSKTDSYWADRMTSADVLRTLSTIHGYERDKYEDRRMMWNLIYQHLTDLGYDAIYFEDTPPDYSLKHYRKIVIFDPKNVRLLKAKFDPAQSDSANLMA